MPTIRLNNFHCFYTYEDFGNQDVLVFSNSLGTDHTMWEPQLDILSHHFNILRYDTRGHGQSTIEQDTLTIAELGQDVLDLLDALNLGQVHFCGLSMGGLIGQWLGINATERFHKITLANTAAKIGTHEGWNARIAQVKEHGLESILEGTAQRWFTPSFRENNPQTVTDILEIFKANSLHGYMANCAAVRDADFREELFNLEVPTLIISGLQDEVTTPQDGKYLAKRIPNARHVQLDAAHLSNLEHSEEFAKHLLHFKEH
ncbi:3-oxoadipate enol-lactonase [Rufibacter glacialis]|uniref:3-oxoadipate enol-lactonase n=1 Tax=Rufibacter glacialis TaxID=1259555 RepID=A0A5M8QJF2_9BACT|nr:3-oxoadipate enol-lactonase [Rufibacter glacialis]KAA6435398.1 3-oxoadipate enol-lactonase [Rufibacter glacialis]GGK63067.1 3-oxoadipate enol-lactonase [Rufibacter glacialis]